MRTAAVEHFRETFDHDAMYSIEAEDVEVCSLESALGQPSFLRKVAPPRVDAMQFEIDGPGDDALNDVGDRGYDALLSALSTRSRRT